MTSSTDATSDVDSAKKVSPDEKPHFNFFSVTTSNKKHIRGNLWFYLNVTADLTYTKICKLKLNLIMEKFQLMVINLTLVHLQLLLQINTKLQQVL